MLKFLALIAGIVVVTGCASNPESQLHAPYPIVNVTNYVPYGRNAAPEELQAECTFQVTLPFDIQKRGKNAGINIKLVDATNQSVSSEDVPLLTIETIATNARGGGGFTGDKWARVRGTLKKGDQIVGDFEILESVGSGQYSACGTLEELSSDISKRVMTFLENPQIGYQHGL